ncbi:DNA polymerase I [bacterium]|nr:DNA polymerase I [bacterium]
MEKKRLFLVDGHNWAYRAFFATPYLSTSKGEPTNCVLSFTNMLLKLLQEEKPTHLAVVLDSSTPTFRHQTYPKYKETRAKMPPEMRHQIPLIKEVVGGFDIACLAMDGYEADDLMATIVKKYEDEVDEIMIITSDKDIFQLVDAKVKVASSVKGVAERVIYDEQKVVEKFGLPPERIRDFLALAGDSSDNIPGVRGIGEKKAKKLLAEFGSFEEIFNNVEKVQGKDREKLLAGKEDACLSWQLVALKSDVPLGVELADLKVREFDEEKLLGILTRLEFKNVLKGLGLKREEEALRYLSLTTAAGFKDLLRRLEKAQILSVDLETTSQDPMQAEIVGISFALKAKEAFYIPLGHLEACEQLDLSYVLKELKPVLEDPGIKKCGQNIKYDLIVLAQHGIRLTGISFDTMIAAYLVKPGQRGLNLETLAMEYLGISKSSFKEIVGKAKNIAGVEIEKVTDYAASDADVALRLVDELAPLLKEKEMEELFYQMELPLMEVLAEMEMNGVRIDREFLKTMSEELETRLSQLKDRIFKEVGQPFNINSHKDLAFILFEKLLLPPLKKTKTGYSTDEEVLRILSLRHPLPAMILEYREMAKLKSTYVDALFELVHPKTGRIHTSFNQTITSTGRLSSSNPNLQNIPVRTDLGRRVRRAFIPCEGHLLLSADYSQIELRILAEVSKDEELVLAFKEGKDIHTETAAQIFCVMPGLVVSEMRQKAKVVNFGIIYGMGAFGLSKETNLPPGEAQKLIDRYFETYKGVSRYMEEIVQFCKENGYVATLWKRRRYLPDINSKSKHIFGAARRAAINAPIQGSAADLIKLATLNISKQLKEQNLKTKMLLQVHDELVFEVPKEEMEKISKLVKKTMEEAASFCVPIEVSMKIGNNWEEME